MSNAMMIMKDENEYDYKKFRINVSLRLGK